jgi:hypothetical protein
MGLVSDRLSEAEIRRALAKCVTLDAIDRALGWTAGIEHRLRERVDTARA